jgi:hypothetical protein
MTLQIQETLSRRRACADDPAVASEDLCTVYLLSNMECAVPQPIQAGIPFAPGRLHEADSLSLVHVSGTAIPAQAEVLARWPDGSIKWLLLDAVCPALGAGGSAWNLRRALSCLPGQRVLCQESSEAIVVQTGPAKFTIDSKQPSLLQQVTCGGKHLFSTSGMQVRLMDTRGRKSACTIDRTVVETCGPVRTTIRMDGQFTGRAPCRWVARLCFYAGTGLMRVRFTLHNPRRARHRGGLWDLNDPGSIFFRELSLQAATAGRDATPVTWVAETETPPQQTVGDFSIYQDSSGGTAWQSRNHVDHTGSSPCQFRGYRVRYADRETTGLRATPLVNVRTNLGSVTAAVPEFWQQFPKAIAVESGSLNLGLFPAQAVRPHELQGGELKTHTAWFHFAAEDTSGMEPLTWVHQPAWLLASPESYAHSQAIKLLKTHEYVPDSRFEGLLKSAVGGLDSLAARREVIDEYGWRHFGELYAEHEQAYYSGSSPIISHYNNQYDVVLGTLLHYLRTGDRRWWDLADPLARHVIDIDIYHTNQDKASYNGGLFWHTDHYKDAATATHRCYSKANQAPGQPYGGGPCNEHNYSSGLLLYYYLTGDPNAREAVLSLADWVIAMDDGARSRLGWVDDGPTGTASSTAELTYHGPGRGCGNSISALLDGWLLTTQEKYLQKAEELIGRSIHPKDDISQRDLLNVEARWSYTVFLTVLARYLDLKTEAGQRDASFQYAQDSLRHYAQWMLHHEIPYFDQVSKLAYPTETWAAQELRKANVLRLAAPHVDEPLRPRLTKRAEELASRAWADLFRFDHPGTTRALAILLVEGLKDGYARSAAPASAPRKNSSVEFGLPALFVPQRVRAIKRIKTFRGLSAALVRLLNPTRWTRFIR